VPLTSFANVPNLSLVSFAMRTSEEELYVLATLQISKRYNNNIRSIPIQCRNNQTYSHQPYPFRSIPKYVLDTPWLSTSLFTVLFGGLHPCRSLSWTVSQSIPDTLTPKESPVLIPLYSYVFLMCSPCIAFKKSTTQNLVAPVPPSTELTQGYSSQFVFCGRPCQSYFSGPSSL
jgi:hypothetical protein